MDSAEKRWYVMRDLKRRNSNTLAIHELAEAEIEAFTPMTQMIMTIGGRRQRREVPVIQDLLFVHDTKETIDGFVAKHPTLQYRYMLGKPKSEPMTVHNEEMERFILAVSHTDQPIYYRPGELTERMLGKQVRIMGGMLNGFIGRLLSVKGMRKRRIVVELPGYIAAGVEVEPDYIQIIN